MIPTTDWTGHPVPNRLNFIFDRLVERSGIDVDVCHFKLFDEEKRETACELIDMDRAPCTDVKHYYLNNLWHHGAVLREIAPKYDAIVSSNIIPGGLASLQEVPIIIDYLDHFPESAKAYYSSPMDLAAERFASWITTFNLKKAEGLITPTENFRDYLTSKTDIPVEVVPNGVDTDIIKPVDSTSVEDVYDLSSPVLGYAGSLESWLDLEHILEIFPTIKRRYPDATLLLVGPGLHTDYSERLEALAGELGIEEDVVFTGQIPYEELAPYISAMDIGLNPRKPIKMNTMTMGSKVLTYLACGVPVLSKNMPTVEDDLGEDKGVYKYKTDEQFLGELARALTRDVDPSVVEEYDWDVLADDYLKKIKSFV